MLLVVVAVPTGHNVEHHGDPPRAARLHERMEAIRAAEPPLDLELMPRPVACSFRVWGARAVSAMVAEAHTTHHHPTVGLRCPWSFIVCCAGRGSAGAERPTSTLKAVVPARLVVHDRADPDGVETHALDVVQLLDDTRERPATVAAVLAAWVIAAVPGASSQREAIGQDLIDSGAPLPAGRVQ